VVIDTNIALRYLLRDDAAGFKVASEIFESPESVIITDLVIFEIVYVMRGTHYCKDRDQVAESITIMLKNNTVSNPSGLAEMYLKLYAKTGIDLVDCYLIAYSLEHNETLKTLDKKMQKIYQTEKRTYNSC